MSVVHAGVVSEGRYSFRMQSHPAPKPMLVRELIGESLREERVSQGKTLREISKSARVSLGYLSEVERADGAHVFGSAHVSEALQEAGFRMTPQGLRLRPSAV